MFIPPSTWMRIFEQGIIFLMNHLMFKMIKKMKKRKLMNLKNMMINLKRIMIKKKKVLKRLRKRQTSGALYRQKKMKKGRRIKQEVKNDYSYIRFICF